MSYWTYLEIDTGGPEPARVTESRNYTSNVSPMWALALGFPYRALDGYLAADAIPILERAVAHMQSPANAKEYTLLNPPNGWGNHEGATDYLQELLDECRLHPKATIGMSY